MAVEVQPAHGSRVMSDPTLDQREAVIRPIAMLADTNPAGDIFGGWLMSQMNLAAGDAAAPRWPLRA